MKIEKLKLLFYGNDPGNQNARESRIVSDFFLNVAELSVNLVNSANSGNLINH